MGNVVRRKQGDGNSEQVLPSVLLWKDPSLLILIVLEVKLAGLDLGRYEPCLARVNTETKHIKRSKADALVNDAPLFLTLPGDGLCISFRSIPRRQQTLGSKIPSIPRTLRLFKYRPPDITMHCRTRMQWRGFCCGEEPLDLTWRPFHSSSQVLKRKIPRRLSCRSKRKKGNPCFGAAP